MKKTYRDYLFLFFCLLLSVFALTYCSKQQGQQVYLPEDQLVAYPGLLGGTVDLSGGHQFGVYVGEGGDYMIILSTSGDFSTPVDNPSFDSAAPEESANHYRMLFFDGQGGIWFFNRELL